MMRWCLAPLVALLAMAPLGQAAVVEDAEGDVHAEANGTAGPPLATPAYASMDLTALDVAEDEDAVTFTLHVADLGGTDDTSPDGMDCDLYAVHNGRAFRFYLSRLLPPLGGFFDSMLVRDGDGAWQENYEADLETTLDPAADTITFRVARGDLADASGTAPFPGRTLEDLHATCFNRTGGHLAINGMDIPVPVAMRDDLPDLGVAPGLWPVQVGAPQTGHALLNSVRPFRASNGEATTIAFNVSAHNTGASDDTFQLTARDVPLGVGVVLAEDDLAIPAGGSTSFKVWVTMPFAHDHGATTQFRLELASTTDPGSVGRIDLGVRYLTIPQPAGHHDTLFVHSIGEQGPSDASVKTAPGVMGNNGYLNTLEEDSRDSHDGLAFTGGSGEVYSWTMYLSPALLMGLDTDLARLGHLQAYIGSRTPMDGATLSASVQVWGDGLVTVASLGEVPLTASGDRYVAEGDMVPHAAADFVPYAEGRNLVLEINVTKAGGFGQDPPYLIPGTWVQLPLLDYHDPVTDMPPTGVVVLAGNGTAAPDPEGKKDTPVTTWLAPLALAMAGLLRRRR